MEEERGRRRAEVLGLIHCGGAPFIAPEERRLHPVRRLVGGGSNDGRSSTELLDCSRKTMTKGYVGPVLVGRVGWVATAGLRPGNFFSLFFSSDSFLFIYLFSVLNILTSI
jgi:hypothetical protein